MSAILRDTANSKYLVNVFVPLLSLNAQLFAKKNTIFVFIFNLLAQIRNTKI
jgi:hypothetical protein